MSATTGDIVVECVIESSGQLQGPGNAEANALSAVDHTQYMRAG